MPGRGGCLKTHRRFFVILLLIYLFYLTFDEFLAGTAGCFTRVKLQQPQEQRYPVPCSVCDVLVLFGAVLCLV